jgi:hypothetical protein
MKRATAALCGVMLACFAVPGANAAAQEAGQKAASRNMRVVGYDELQGRSAFQAVIVLQQGRWIAYVGHHGGVALNPLTGKKESNGTSILDVTDPKRPKYLHHIPSGSEATQEVTGGEGSGAQMVQICAGKDLPKGDPSKHYMMRTNGRTSHEIWDVTNPERPAFLSTVVDKLSSTHREAWECDTGIAYLNSGLPGWKVLRMTQVFDVSDPAKPVHIRDFALPGQEPTAAKPKDLRIYDGHGAFSLGPKANRVYFGYGQRYGGAYQIVDREKLLTGPKEPTPENLLYPQIAFSPLGEYLAVHSVLPLMGMEIKEFARDTKGKVRDFLLVLPEPLANECNEERQMMFIVDITHESKPLGVSTFSVPEAQGSYCTRGARFGPHQTQENLTPIYHKRIVFVAWFNAGVRAVDIRNPYQPTEIGYFVPGPNRHTEPSCVKVDGNQRCKTVSNMNNVEVDDRGYVYTTDRQGTGMHILELTGSARKIANWAAQKSVAK